jgi:hypothetical protein
MAMSRVAPMRQNDPFSSGAARPFEPGPVLPCRAERSMCGASSTLWRAFYVRDPEGHRRANPAWENANATIPPAGFGTG